MKNKKGVMEGVLGNILYIAVIFVVLIFFLAIITPIIFNRSTDLLKSESDNDTLLIDAAASDLAGSNCVAGSETCYNYSGGTQGSALGSGNITWTDSTCSVVLTATSGFNNTNVLCTYTYEDEDYRNVSAATVGLAEQTNTLIPVAFGIIALIMIFIAIAVLRRNK